MDKDYRNDKYRAAVLVSGGKPVARGKWAIRAFLGCGRGQL